MLIREVWSILLVLCSIGRSEDNVALNKTAEQSSDLFVDKWLANKAVDGCENTNVYSDCCTHTGPNTEEAWWRVDLGELMTVNQITIYYRDGCKPGFCGDHCDKSCPSVCSGNTCDQTTSACTEENSNMRAAAIGIGTGFGLTIVILVIVVIVLARSLRKTQSDNKSPSDVTDISELDRGKVLHMMK
ncbi:uncharacterized protein [Argopecten irradians]|uniref:uncharacterized protein isoform X3 n=1 Tax=Argopecten irradians TaxID=31199 RepID=UPI003721FB85